MNYIRASSNPEGLYAYPEADDAVIYLRGKIFPRVPREMFETAMRKFGEKYENQETIKHRQTCFWRDKYGLWNFRYAGWFDGEKSPRPS